MADPYRITDDWQEGYDAGFASGYQAGLATAIEKNPATSMDRRPRRMSERKPKRKQSGKAKLLTTMTAPVWKKYRRGNGKKTYVQIRAQVSRSQAYKRKAKKL